MPGSADLTPHAAAAWWSAVVEPGDAHAAALRAALGEGEAIAWVLADAPGPLPEELAVDGAGRRRDWDSPWSAWRPRALVADPEADLGLLGSLGGHLVLPGAPGWPPGLGDLGLQAPVALWVLGDVPEGPAVAVVGSRAATAYGIRVAGDLALEVAEHGVEVVSGGAFGVDVAAHRAAAAAEGGHTTVVMAGGLANLYPAAHEQFFLRLVRDGRGAVVSECPPSWRPAKWRFLGRNRMIAAMTAATVVVEASARSGALSTARHARDLNRHIGAVPGPVTSAASQGCHTLLRDGATLVRSGRDVLEMVLALGTLDLGPLPGAPVQDDVGTDALPPDLRRVWEALPRRGSTTLQRLTRAAGLSEHDVLSALAHLQLAGLVDSGGGSWSRVR